MKKITGVMIYYYFVCQRKLWYFSHQMDMEQHSDLVGMGKLIDETSYTREKKHIMIDETINVDFLKDWHIVHEVKKSKHMEEASVWQLKYYMMVLREKGLDIEEGILDYPMLRRRVKVQLTAEDVRLLEEAMQEIGRIISEPVPPLFQKKGICKNCSYFELCRI